MPSNAILAGEVAAFAAKHEPCRDRWLYCLDRSLHRYRWRDGRVTVELTDKLEPCARFLGVSPSTTKLNLGRIRRDGYDAYVQYLAERGYTFLKVGPIEPWNIGHVYFARPKGFPHIVKVGFSRRVRQRIEDIEHQIKLPLVVTALKVGTLADEKWWHNNWQEWRIDGEWFFHPFDAARELPPFISPDLMPKSVPAPVQRVAA